MQHEDREEYREESLDMFDYSKDLSTYTVKIIGEYVENYNLELTIKISDQNIPFTMNTDTFTIDELPKSVWTIT